MTCTGTFGSWARKNLSFKEERDFSSMTRQNELHFTYTFRLIIQMAYTWQGCRGDWKVALGCVIPVPDSFKEKSQSKKSGPYTPI